MGLHFSRTKNKKVRLTVSAWDIPTTLDNKATPERQRALIAKRAGLKSLLFKKLDRKDKDNFKRQAILSSGVVEQTGGVRLMWPLPSQTRLPVSSLHYQQECQKGS